MPEPALEPWELRTKFRLWGPIGDCLYRDFWGDLLRDILQI